MTASPSADRTAWFRDARYGMFIHWGVYSVPAGIYRGERVVRGDRFGNINPLGEWIMHAAKIPVAEYAEYAKQFNPVKFDADAWVRLAKDAGMKYIVITSKHHDGFAMFKSAASSFNIVDATPFKRDPLRELADACKRHGIRLGFYYSQAQDWHHPGGAAYPRKGRHAGGDPALGHWDPAQNGSFDEYIDRIAVPQVRELLTNYGHISILWWDTPVGMKPEHAERLASLLRLQPHLVTNNRLFDPQLKTGPFTGDTSTPEQQIPTTGAGDRMFEVCMTMNETWGFKSYDDNWKPASDIVRKLVDIASKGGNFLLNVGPTAEGEIPVPSVERLREAGVWIKANGEAIYGTTASLFRRLPWGRSTTKGNCLYLHVFDWPTDGRLVLPGLKTVPRRATILRNGTPLEVRIEKTNTIVTLPASPIDPVASVIKLEFESAPVVAQALPIPDEQGVIELPAVLAAVVNSYGGNARLVGAGKDAHIGYWDRAGTTLNWEFRSERPASYVLEAEVALAAPASVNYSSGKSKGTVKLEPTGGLDAFRTSVLGSIVVDTAGDYTLDLKSIGPNWSEVRLRGVRLRRTDGMQPAAPASPKNVSAAPRSGGMADKGARLQPQYPIPYAPASIDEVTVVLDRVLGYLERCTPDHLVDSETGARITDFSQFNPRAVPLPSDFNIVSYEWGVTYAGMLLASASTGDPRFADYAARRLKLLADYVPLVRAQLAAENAGAANASVEKQARRRTIADRTFVRAVVSPRSLDDSGSMCAAMIKAQRAGVVSTGLQPMIENYMDWISYKQKRFPDGTLARDWPLANSLWLDDLFMSVPALAQMGALTRNGEYFDDAVRQVLQFSERMFVRRKGLFLHGWVEEMDVHPAFFWARANGWALMAMTELLDVLPTKHPKRRDVMDLFRAQVRGLRRLQGGNGLWHQLLNRPDSYEETSASAIYVYAIARGVNRGWLDPLAHGPMLTLGWNAVAKKVTSQGQVEGTCIGTGMGFDPMFYYYRPTSPLAAHGYGPVLLAGAEYIAFRKGIGKDLCVSGGALQNRPAPAAR